MNDNLRKYITHGYRNVEGFFSYLALKTIAKLSEIQSQNKITGAVCEIGVHHGRSFILLHLLTNGHEKSVAYDLFEMQEQNVDKSGEGDKGKLLFNLNKHKCDLSRINVILKNSLSLTPEQVLNDANGTIKIFSIDGGHTSEIVYHDLEIGENTISNGGIIIVDDVFEDQWPGVSEGTCKYLLGGNSKLIPVAVFDNKVAFTNMQHMKEIYQAGLRTLAPEFIFKESKYFGTKILVLWNSSNRIIDTMRKTKLWQLIKDNKLGKSIRKIIKS